MKSVRLGDIATLVRGVSFSKEEGNLLSEKGYLPVIRAGSIQESLLLHEGQIWVPARKIKSSQKIRTDDIVMCTSSGSSDLVGKCARSTEDFEGSFGAFCAGIRAHQEKASPSYLYHFLCSPVFKVWTRASSGANIKNIRVSELAEFQVPLPSLPEQKRIAAILDKAYAIRRKRRQAIQLADDFLRAVFLDMFGDPVTNPKGWKTACLEELVKVVSGATPSKSNDAYWAGEFPWVSPKDMKSVEISSSIDHVNQVVFERENLKKLPVGSVLIVVRGMILAHTVPVGITTTEVAINQDIKAFVSSGRVLPEFLLWFLLSQHANLLSKVTTAAHGTKRFDMVDLLGLPVFVPDIGAQRKFVSIVGSYKETLAELDWSHKNALQIFNSLSQKAFSGQL
ncbi:restriction endonuclease subunit S [Halopseudomonas sp.]|uniref:restriction endonuclease subunit S n=1 Tax=Halopseudomonas sp. TaxID=2901191 RepID=UPI00300394CD